MASRLGMEAPQEGLVELFASQTRKDCLDRALVLQARAIPHTLAQARRMHVLLVPSAHARDAFEELRDYGIENVGWPPARDLPPFLGQGQWAGWVFALSILTLYPIGRYDLAHLGWWSQGKLIAGDVLEGEWWRATTALTLHGSPGHLLGNLVFGWGFAILAVHTMGVGITWMGVLIAGTLGNGLNALIQDPSHSSVGASTAVFGCLGLMASYEWVRRERLHLGSMRRFAPLLAAATLLGYLGMGGEQAGEARTDVMAHVTGMGVGLALGWMIGRTRLPDRLGLKAQWRLALSVPIWVGLCWWCALS